MFLFKRNVEDVARPSRLLPGAAAFSVLSEWAVVNKAGVDEPGTSSSSRVRRLVACCHPAALLLLTNPMDLFHHERELLSSGVTEIAGVDEAGRGPLAGPVVAAAVVLPCDWIIDGLPRELRAVNDSKQLTEKKREELFEIIHGHGEIRQAIVSIPAEVIDEINILRATHRAMVEALAALEPVAAHVLVDGLKVNAIKLPQTPLVKGDSLSYSIAAASILAKVYRDRLMREYDVEFPGYGFAKHKGYGTKQHLAALAEHGACPIHRKSFAPVSSQQLDLL